MGLRRVLLYTVFALNVYMLLVIILFKISIPQLNSIVQQIQLVMERPSMLEGRWLTANFTPFATIKESFSRNLAPIQWLNLYGNIAIFIPTGLIAAILYAKHPFTNAVFVSFIISLSLESLQLFLLMGSFDIDDLLLNTSGGAVGGLLALIVFRLRGPAKAVTAEESI